MVLLADANHVVDNRYCLQAEVSLVNHRVSESFSSPSYSQTLAILRLVDVTDSRLQAHWKQTLGLEQCHARLHMTMD